MINERLTHEELESLSLAMKSHFEVMAESASEAEAIECSQIVRALRELQERRNAEKDSEPVYQYRIRNGYNGQVTEWQTIRRDQVDFVIKAQPLNAEFRIIATPQPALVVPDEITSANAPEVFETPQEAKTAKKSRSLQCL